MKVGHHILLVGEGNFSFSASLCDASDRETHVTATCYQSEAMVAQQGPTRNNIQHLREKGAEVYFQVDCTKLKEFFAPANKEFDHILFNFPHCGKKAGVKRNRELLAHFFRSCAEVLREKGEVHVTLCKGQGGTPADHPVREWHNSWQIVAMAASAGFILSEVLPFSSDVYAGYKCTGYRSQEKPFHVEGALMHIFTRSLPLLGPTSANVQSKQEDAKACFHVPDVLLDMINRDFLAGNSHHPVRAFNERLIAGISSAFSLQRVDESPQCLHLNSFHSVLSWTSGVSPSNVFWMSVAKDGNMSSGHVGGDPDRGSDASVSRCRLYVCEVDNSGDQKTVQGKDHNVSAFCLRPSLTVYIHNLLQRPDFVPEKVYAISGPVFRRCLISLWPMPVYHETLFLCGCRKSIEGPSAQLLMDAIANAVESVLRSLPHEIQNNPDNELEIPKINRKSFSVSYRQQVKKGEYMIHLEATSLDPGDARDLCIGHIVTLPPGETCCDLHIVLAMLNLDALVMLVLDITDWRMLWTYDERFVNQFDPVKLKRFHSFSMFPPSYIHDISFWVRDRALFDDVEFHTLVRHVSKESVTDIQLLDSFAHPETGRISLCYRLTYQSCDRALSADQASKMQLQLRQELQRLFQVTLR